MIRLFPYHRLKKLLIAHTFYNGLVYSMKITIDAFAGSALMNKNIEDAYALIKEVV